MKKIFLIIVSLSLMAFTKSEAQSVLSKMTNPNGASIDTATNATAEGPVLKVAGYQSTLSIVLAVTKISGTVGGSVQWQGSNDGVNYGTISSTTITDGSVNYVYSETPKRYLYYKANVAGTGTMSASYSAWLYALK